MTRPLWLCHGSPPRCPPLPLLLLLVPALCMASAQSHTGGLLRLKGTAQHGALQLQEEAGAEPGLVPSPNLQQPCWHRRCIETPGTGTPSSPHAFSPGARRGERRSPAHPGVTSSAPNCHRTLLPPTPTTEDEHFLCEAPKEPPASQSREQPGPCPLLGQATVSSCTRGKQLRKARGRGAGGEGRQRKLNRGSMIFNRKPWGLNKGRDGRPLGHE